MTLVAKRTVEDEVRDERGRWSEAESLVLKYSEDEARDDHGRWTSGSSGAGAASLAASASRGLRTGGFSLHPNRGSAPTSGYQVAMTGHTEQYPIEKVDRKSLTKAFESYLQKHKDILTPGGNRYLGGWVEGGKLWLEPSEHVKSKRDAIALGQKRDQVAVWDNRRKEEIPTGGSGGLDSGALADEIRRTPGMSDEEHNVRKDKEDEQPTRAMEDLVQRRGVRVAADLKPGDVITGKGNDGASRYATIETRLPDETEDYAIFTYRRPSGRLGNMRMLKSNSVSGERDKTKYVGSERPAPKFSGVSESLRKFEPALSRQIDKAVDLSRQALSPSSRKYLTGLKISSATMRSDLYARYVQLSGDRGFIELNNQKSGDNWTGDFGAVQQTVESGFHPPRNGYGAVTAIVAHEIGHHLATVGSSVVQRGLRPTYETLHQLAGGPASSGEAVMGIVGSQLSSYATTNEQEMCAEAWAEYVCASHPRPISRVIGGYMSGTEEGEKDANSVLETLGAHR